MLPVGLITGHRDGLFNAGVMLLNGQGVGQDAARGRAMVERAAQLGGSVNRDVSAALSIGAGAWRDHPRHALMAVMPFTMLQG